MWSVGALQNKRMPLHWAASGGHTDIVKYLLDLRVPIDEKDDVSVPYLPVGYVVLGTQDNPPTELPRAS